ncbi:MAG: DNA primase [Gemmatimonadetes bacterium]|nr:DNA primase [Gemmatimonadota bacterium]
MIPDALVEEVRARADIVEIIGANLPLKRAGKDFRALCPFHHEKTPSFYVVPAKGFFKCFGCGESGDVFTFLMKRNGVGFLEAVREVAARVGVDLPAPGDANAADEPHRLLFEAIAFAVDHFNGALADARGEGARRYLEGRGIDAGTIDRFRIGYAPDEWRGLREAAHRHGMEDAVLLEAGLIKESERAEEPYDRFRDRIIFPITEVTGRTVAFGGRALHGGESVPKYLNSPETPIYHKGGILYGLNWSKSAIRRESATLVVEGYMDYVSLAARGVENVAAGMGTALTTEQANLIARYTAKAYLIYDSDPAGLRATFRSADALLRAGVHPLVVTLPAGEDPDSVVRKGGAAALRPFLDGAVDVLERKLQMLTERGYFADIDGARRALDGLLPTIRATIDPALRDIYINRVAERTGVRPETLEHEAAESGVRTRPGLPRWPGRRPDRPGDGGGARDDDRPAPGRAERDLLLMMLRDPARVDAAGTRITADELSSPVNRALFEAMVAARGSGAEVDAANLEAPVANLLASLQSDPLEITDGDRTFEDALAGIKERPLMERLADISAQLRTAGEERAVALVREKRQVHEELTRLHGRSAFKASRRYRMFARDHRRTGKPATDEE